MFLKNRIAFVTGGTRGIGRAIAVELAKNGASIVFNYLKSDDDARTLIKQIEELGQKAYGFKLSVTNFDGISNMVKKVKKEIGMIDILVNNAGITRDSALAMMRKEDWTDVIDTNLNGMFNCSKSVIIDMMKYKKGDIVNITSVSGMIGLSRQTNYSTTKAGMIGFTKALAKEVANYNIRVNAVAPGGINTSMTTTLHESLKEEMIKSTPLKRFGTTEEVSSVVAFLLSEKAKYITGHVIPVDGGLAI